MAKSEIGQCFFSQFSSNRRTAELISGEHNLLVSKLTFKFSLYLVQFIVIFTIGLNKQLNHPEVWSPIANNMAILFGSGFFVISFATIYNSKYWIHHLQFMGDLGGGDFHVDDRCYSSMLASSSTLLECRITFSSYFAIHYGLFSKLREGKHRR